MIYLQSAINLLLLSIRGAKALKARVNHKQSSVGAMALLISHAKFDSAPCPNGTSSSMDASVAPFPELLWYVKPWYEISVKAGLFLPVVVGGIVANVAILDAVRRNHLLRLAPLNIYIANMAACDLCALLLGPWLLLCIDSFQNFVLGPFFCKTEGFVQSNSHTLSNNRAVKRKFLSCPKIKISHFLSIHHFTQKLL